MRIQTTKGCREATAAEEEALTAAVKAIVDAQCRHEGTVPMGPTAQRIHGRENHVCNRPKGHGGPHAWLGHDGAVFAEWPQEADTIPLACHVCRGMPDHAPTCLTLLLGDGR